MVPVADASGDPFVILEPDVSTAVGEANHGAFIGHAFFMTQETEIEVEKAVHVGMSLMLVDQTGTFDGGGAIVVPIERAIGIDGLGININGYQQFRNGDQSCCRRKDKGCGADHERCCG